MALTLGEVITSVRNRSPLFHKSRGTPDKVLGDLLRDIQNELIGKAVLRDKQFLSQTATIVLNLNSGDVPATVGAGSNTGLPGAVSSSGVITTVRAMAGRLVQIGLTAEDGATVAVAAGPVTSATTTSVTRAGQDRTIDGDIDKVLVILAGAGSGQARYILANTADTWTISNGDDGLEWTEVPDETSLVQVVIPAYVADGSAGAVNQLPATRERPGYLVRIAADGTAFLDPSTPLVATIEDGVALPSGAAVLSGEVWNTEGKRAPLAVLTTGQRSRDDWDDEDACHAITVRNSTVYLVGTADAWNNIASLSLEYSPVAPEFTALTDAFLLPDSAKQALVAKGAAKLARRTAETGLKLDVKSYDGEAADAENDFLRQIRIAKRGRVNVMREG